MTIRIKNWSKHQHFKDRTPPWIKLYREILDDPDWHDLSGDDAKLLVGLWLVASEDISRTGALPDARKLAFRMRISESDLDQALNRLSQWLIRDDINAISERYLGDAPEGETEAEGEAEGETAKPPVVPAEQKEGKRRKPPKTLLPENFAVSDAVKAWAESKGHSRLPEHLESFVSKAKAKAYEYADWDQAFMNAIRDDWANLGKSAPPKRRKQLGEGSSTNYGLPS